MRRIHQTMGTVASIDIVDGHEYIFKEVFKFLDYINEHFSVYNENSEISRYNMGKIKQPSEDLNYLLVASARYFKETGGYFSVNFDGRFNPTGLVKGWAIKRAGELLQAKGFNEFMINVGGDILATSNGEKIWSIGLQHPTNKQVITGVIRAKNLAVATSGAYERGQHIINPLTKKPTKQLLSVTVFGKDIIKVDVLATTIMAMGQKRGTELIKSQADYEAIIINNKLEVMTTAEISDIPSVTMQSAQ